jgi:allantoin racemase
MKPSVLVITPVVDTGAIDVEPALAPFRTDRVTITNVFIDEGPPAVETEADVIACLPEVMRAARGATADAVVINCMCDPGVPELRQVLSVPVFGAAQTSMHVAASLGMRFSVIDVLPEGREYVERQVQKFGLGGSFASHRALGIPVLELFRDPERTLKALEREARHALEDDGADSLLLGCTGLAQLAVRFNARLASQGRSCQILEPFGITLGVACAAAANGRRSRGRAATR